MDGDDAIARLREERAALVARLAQIDAELPADAEATAPAQRHDERWFRAVFDASYQLMAVLDPSGRLVDGNRAVFEAVGPDAAGRIGMRWWEVPSWVTPEDAAAAHAAVDEARAGPRRSFVARLRARDGRILTLECSVRPVLDDGGRLLAFLAEARDLTAERRAVAALEESEARLQGVLDEIEDVVCTFDLDSPRTLYMSPSAIRVLGRPAEEFVAQEGALLDVFHPDDRQVLAEFRRRARERGSAEVEVRVVRPDGTERWVRLRVHVVRGRDGAEKWGQGVITDVTERRVAAEALARSSRRFRRLIEQGWDIIALASADGRIEFVSDSVRRVRGYSPEEALAIPFADHLHPDDAGRVMASLRSLVAEPGGIRTNEMRMRHKGGSWVWVEAVTVNLLDDPDVHALVTNARDITVRKQAEAALAASEATLRQITEHIREVFWVLDLQANAIVYVSPAYAQVWGRPPSELAIAPDAWIEGIHPDDRLVARAFQAAFGRGEPTQAEYRVVRADGAIRHVRDQGFPVVGDDGKVARVVGIAVDITDEKLAEHELVASRDALAKLAGELERRVAERTAELSLANAALGRASRAKDEFLASMSHELRTPLNAVLGLCEALDEDVYGSVTDPQRRAIGRIAESGRHLLELIGDILDLSKIEAGRVALDVGPVSANDVCRASLAMIQEAAQRKKQRVWLQIQDGFLTVPADERRLKQILVNLLANAVKFTPSGGTVGLEVSSDEAGDGIRFTVADNGIGISREGQARLFQPFVQLDSSLTREHAGTGLGLALVRRLVELHGGSVTVDSEPGKGSRFTVVLPRRRALGTPDDRPPSAFAPRALIVEDSRPVAEQIARYVREADFVPMIHDSSQGVVARAASSQPQVIFLDILLPAEVGWDILRDLKADPRTRQIPVIVVSVLDRPEKGLALGADGYLVKPVSRERLLAALSSISTPRAPSQSVLIVSPAPGGKRAPRILLAEDDETNVVTLIDFLRSREYEVFVARNGKEAVRLTREVRPDLILMDIQMPVMDGFRATELIRADASREIAATPIVAVTALAMTGDRERCLAAGANEYLTKPVGLKRLASVIEGLLPTR